MFVPESIIKKYNFVINKITKEAYIEAKNKNKKSMKCVISKK